MFGKPFDHELYINVVKLTQKLAKEKGILWQEEQAELVYEVITNDFTKDLGLDDGSLRRSEYNRAISHLNKWGLDE